MLSMLAMIAMLGGDWALGRLGVPLLNTVLYIYIVLEQAFRCAQPLAPFGARA